MLELPPSELGLDELGALVGFGPAATAAAVAVASGVDEDDEVEALAAELRIAPPTPDISSGRGYTSEERAALEALAPTAADKQAGHSQGQETGHADDEPVSWASMEHSAVVARNSRLEAKIAQVMRQNEQLQQALAAAAAAAAAGPRAVGNGPQTGEGSSGGRRRSKRGSSVCVIA